MLIALALLLLLLLTAPFLLPLPPGGSTPARELADPDSRFIHAGGLEVHYKQVGAGEPALVLLHGFAASAFSWRELLRRPGGLGTLYAFDRPAFGLTERPLPGDYSPEAQADLVAALLDAWQVERAVLVGNSAGGSIALLTALRHPHRVEGLVLVDAAVYRGGGAPPFIKPLLRTAWGRRVGLHITRRFGTAGPRFLASAWHDPAKVTPAVIEVYQKPTRAERFAEALWEFTLQSRSPDLARRLKEVRQPALVITGADDRIVPAAQSVRLSQELPDARLVVIPHCGHLPQEECPEPVAEAIRTFLADLRREGR
ncbi:MAG: alpha/beta fold hydrolase [Bacillota bacterium]